MQCGSTADASGHECVMSGAQHRFWCKPILFLLATRVTQERSPLTSAMPRVKVSAFPRLHEENFYGHTKRTDLKWQNKVIYPLVKDAQPAGKTSRTDTNVEDSPHVKHDDIQCKTEETITLWTDFQPNITSKNC